MTTKSKESLSEFIAEAIKEYYFKRSGAGSLAHPNQDITISIVDLSNLIAEKLADGFGITEIAIKDVIKREADKLRKQVDEKAEISAKKRFRTAK